MGFSLGGLLKTAAPIVGTALGGPIGGAIAGGLVGAIGGNASTQAGNAAARMAGNPGFNASFGNMTIGPDGKPTYSLSPDQQKYADLAQSMGFGALGRYSADPMSALTDDQRSFYGDASGALGTAGNQYGTLAAQYFHGLTSMGSNPTEIGNNYYHLLRDQAQPGIDMAHNSLDNKLFARGMLGTSGGALQERALNESDANADIGRQIAGADYGRQWFNDMNTAFGNAAGGASNAAISRFGLAGQLLAAGNQNNQYALNDAGSFQGLYDNTFAPLAKFAGLDTGNPYGASMQLGTKQNQIDAYTGAGSDLLKGVFAKVGSWMGGTPPGNGATYSSVAGGPGSQWS